MHKLTEAEIADIKNDKSILLDVRSEQEYSTGHAANSLNKPVDELEDLAVDKSKKIFVYCAAGGRAQMAQSVLSQKGYQAINIGGLSEAIDAMGEA